MKKYNGSTTVLAEPMKRLAYNEFRGWVLPDDEDGTDEGYLVENLAGGVKGNVPGREGYVSWLPKEQFERMYAPAGGVAGIDRLNACFKEFPEEVKALLHHSVPCPEGLKAHVLHREGPGGATVSLLGLLNGTLFHDGDRLASVVGAPSYASREEELASIECYDIISQYRLKHFEVSEPVIDDFLASIKPGEDLDRLIAAGVLSEGVEVATGAALDEIIDERTGKDAE